MSLLIVTTKSLKVLAKNNQVKRLFANNTKVMVTDLAFHKLKGEVGFNVVKRLIYAGYIAEIETVSLNKIDQYKELNLNIDQYSIRELIDKYAEKAEIVTILVDEDWAEMQLENIQIISANEYLKRNPLVTSEMIRKMVRLRNLE